MTVEFMRDYRNYALAVSKMSMQLIACPEGSRDRYQAAYDYLVRSKNKLIDDFVDNCDQTTDIGLSQTPKQYVNKQYNSYVRMDESASALIKEAFQHVL